MKKCYQILCLSILIPITLLSQGEWKTLKTGAGGWITGLHIHASGDPIFARSDVGSAYRWIPSSQSWVNIVTSENLPTADVQWQKFSGVLSIVSAPSNADIAYLAYYDGIYKSTNQGDTWVKTNLPETSMDANTDEGKLSGERLAVDPLDANVVYFGSLQNGLWKTENGGEVWTKINLVPNGEFGRGIRTILFDESSGTTSGQTSTLYAMVDGEGVYQSNDAGSTWTVQGFGVLNPYFYDAEISADGRLYVSGETDNYVQFGVQRFYNNMWTQVFDDNVTIGEIAIDPFNTNRIFIFSFGFTDTYRTTNGESNSPTWDYLTRNVAASNIPWLGWTYSDWFSIGEIVFDPAVQDKLWIADGVGVWNSTDLSDNNMTWTENSVDQEHLVSNDLVVANGKVITAHWDRPIFYHEDVEEYPTIHQPTSRFNSSWDLDVSPTDPNFVVAIVEDHRYCCFDNDTRSSGYSTDGGQTWTKFATMPEPGNSNLIFGTIAVSANDNDNIVWLPSGDRMPYFTTDRGTTWTQVTLPNNSGNCCLGGHFLSRQALAADRVLANTFYIYDWGEGTIFKSTNGGQTWTKQINGGLTSWAWNGKLMSVPDHANHLLFANGPEDALSFIEGLYHSTDGGATWNILPNTNEVLNVAVGKADEGASYPTIFIQGKVNGTEGYFMSTDEGATWTQIGTYPNGIYDSAKVMEGDMNIFGRLYVGYAGNGFVYYDADATTPLPIDLVYFNAEVTENKQVKLTWKSAVEIDNDYFDIERSQDGVTFEKLDRVDGSGTTLTGASYTAIDSNPIEGISYYRIKQVDFDGSFSYFPIKTVYLDESLYTVSVFPNPARDKVTLTIDVKTRMESQISLISIDGKTMFLHDRKTLQKGEHQLDFSMKNIPRGVYFLQIRNMQNGEALMKKIVVD